MAVLIYKNFKNRMVKFNFHGLNMFNISIFEKQKKKKCD